MLHVKIAVAAGSLFKVEQPNVEDVRYRSLESQHVGHPKIGNAHDLVSRLLCPQ